MEADIAVENARENAAMGHANAADHQMIAVTKGVNVVASAGPDIAEHGAEASFFAHKIFGCRQFHVCRIAFKCRHRQSRPFRQRGIVGEIAAALARGAAMGIENDVKSKRLRCLRDPQPRTLRRGFDVAVAVDQFDSVGNGYRRHRSTGAARRIDRTRDQRAVTKGRAAS